MCGIVGLMIRNPALQSQLGEWAQPMLIGMTERGPDSAGIAVFTAPLPDGLRKLSLQAPDGFDWDTLRAALTEGESLALRANHGVLVSPTDPLALRARLRWCPAPWPRAAPRPRQPRRHTTQTTQPTSAQRATQEKSGSASAHDRRCVEARKRR